MTRPAACAALLLLLAACPHSDDPQFIDAPDVVRDGGDGGGGFPVDAPPVTGTSHTHVARSIRVPTTASEAMALGLDIDERPNDGIDNQLGMVFGSFNALAPDLDIATAAQTAIDRGTDILLFELQTPDLIGPVFAGLSTFQGANPNPPACASPTDTVCRKHLQGEATFDLGAARTEVAMVGMLVDERFLGQGGTIVAPVTISAGGAAWMTLHRAKSDIRILAPSRYEGKLGGAIAMGDIDTVLIPQLAISLRASFAADCAVGSTPPACACIPGSTGETLRSLFDKAPTQDCMISDAEVRAVVSGFLTPDIDLSGDGVNDAISIGLGIDVIFGRFTPP